MAPIGLAARHTMLLYLTTQQLRDVGDVKYPKGVIISLLVRLASTFYGCLVVHVNKMELILPMSCGS